jgi:hypothetical protein
MTPSTQGVDDVYKIVKMWTNPEKYKSVPFWILGSKNGDFVLAILISNKFSNISSMIEFIFHGVFSTFLTV